MDFSPGTLRAHPVDEAVEPQKYAYYADAFAVDMGEHVPMRTTLGGPALPVETCTRRLADVGVRPVASTGSELELQWPGESGQGQGAEDHLDCDISWYGPTGEGDEEGSEATVQAMSGLMYLHGRDLGGPRRIGVEVASVAAGMLAAHGLLAAAIGRRRGCSVSGVSTSVLQAGLLQASHYFAAATCVEEWVPALPAPAPGPPFRSADGIWFEMETLDTDAWRAFWIALGAGDADLGRGWTLFRPRYYRGTTSLPPGLHEATAARTFSEISQTARACRVSLCPVRGYGQVLVEPGRWAGNPLIEPLSPRDGGAFGGTRTAEGRDRRREVGRPGGRPLEGMEVVEATSRLQGPLAGLLLQMLGAHVTRVEPPGGDISRGVPPLAGDDGSFYLCFNRGKSSVQVDLGSPGGRAELRELVAGADVFLHNWRPGKAAEWGLEAEDLSFTNPRLVYAEASGWGDAPGMSSMVGTDFLVQAYSGLGHAISPEPDPPAPSRVLLTDFMGALVTCEGVLSGLYRREQEGHGWRVRTSLLAGAMALGAHVVDGVAGGREQGRRSGRPVWGPLDMPVPTADGHIVLSITDAAAFERLCKICGVDPYFGDRIASERLVVERIANGSSTHWQNQLEGEGILSAVVATDLASAWMHPRLSPLFEPLYGTCTAPASPWRYVP